MPQGRKWQMGHPNMHKAPRWSQLSKTNTGALKWNGPTRMRRVGWPYTAWHDAPKKIMPQGRKSKMGHRNMHKAAEWSQLSKIDMGTLERNGPTRPEHTWSGNLTRRDMVHPTEWCHKGENDKRATRTCTRHPGGHNLAKLIRAPSNEAARRKRARSGTPHKH